MGYKYYIYVGVSCELSLHSEQSLEITVVCATAVSMLGRALLTDISISG